jgi:hypothetical protein
LDLEEVLRIKDGFYAFDSALLVRPYINAQKPRGVVEWNNTNLWKREYDEGLNQALFFAEDVFGGQFCIYQGRVHAFDPETGVFELIGDCLDDWASSILSDTNFRTGHSLARAWQSKYGSLPLGTRLAPKLPFILGGRYEIDNLAPVDEVEAVGFRLSIAKQIRDLPDGSKVILKATSGSGFEGT